MTPCQKLGYKVGDKFIIQKESEGFTKGQTVKLYKDDGTDKPLFRGFNMRYNHCDGLEGAYYDLDSVTKIVKEEKEEMQFDMKKEPWFINVNSLEESKAAQQWLFDQGLTWCTGDKKINNFEIGCLTNFILYDEIEVEQNGFMHSSKNHIHTGKGEREVKLTFKTIVDSVTFPEVKTEQQKQIEELEKTILLAQQQIETLKKGE